VKILSIVFYLLKLLSGIFAKVEKEKLKEEGREEVRKDLQVAQQKSQIERHETEKKLDVKNMSDADLNAGLVDPRVRK
jgi:hypothetical protein